MLKSLFSGVSGLQSHQIAMDVESNNIANVNTVGFKYSRANFSDLLAQTNQIATAPQGQLGGKNAVQIGLGSTVSSVTRLHSQGSIQNTDKNTDVAIQGDGFFIVSSDGGNTYKYTRSGDFKFDANGNFVDNNGFVAQGWVRNETTGEVDATAPIQNILIPPGLTTPAQASSGINLKANLNAGNLITQSAPTYAIDTAGNFVDSSGTVIPAALSPSAEDFSVLFNGNGEAYNLQSATAAGGGQGITIDISGAGAIEFRYTDALGTNPAVTAAGATAGAGGTNFFRTVNDLRSQIQEEIQKTNPDATVTVSSEGKFIITNPDQTTAATATQFDLTIASIADANTNENVFFTQALQTVQGVYTTSATNGTSRISQSSNAAVHSSSIDIFDSLGSKHTTKIDFRKTSVSSTAGSPWDYTITVPNPASISGAIAPDTNILSGGQVSFDSTGALSTYNITSFDFTANNGSASPQQVQLNFGSINGFDGLTSFDNPSATSGISQDGFPGGDLVGIRIDQSGTLVGSFTNGRSFGLAQISMAKFANNEGLITDGGNVYLQTANSGDPIIGTAATAGRGFIQSAALEASNVDLSRSLTQLIIIQRGFQANGKTITTSDQLLNTLINLKQ